MLPSILYHYVAFNKTILYSLQQNQMKADYPPPYTGQVYPPQQATKEADYPPPYPTLQ